MCIGAPSIPDPPPPPPPPAAPSRLPDEGVSRAGADERRRARAAAGFMSTIRTPTTLIGTAQAGAKSLLGT